MRTAIDSQPHVLVVDDETAVRTVITRVLTRDGMLVESVASGEQALDVLNGNRFKAIVSDLNMPGIHGIELLRCVRQVDLDVPFIVLTGNATLESAIAVIEYGGFRYLQKPIENAALVAVVRRAAAMHDLAVAKRRALELCHAGAWLIGDPAGLDARFDRALEGLWMTFQPVVAWPERSVYGYEALVRSGELSLATSELLFEAAGRLGRVPELGRAIRAETAACVSSAPQDATNGASFHAGG